MKRNCTICVAKPKALIRCAVTAQLICAFGFAYADCWFSDAAAQIKILSLPLSGFKGYCTYNQNHVMNNTLLTKI